MPEGNCVDNGSGRLKRRMATPLRVAQAEYLLVRIVGRFGTKGNAENPCPPSGYGLKFPFAAPLLPAKLSAALAV